MPWKAQAFWPNLDNDPMSDVVQFAFSNEAKTEGILKLP